MKYTVQCRISGCSFDKQVVSDLEQVFELQDEHVDQIDETHRLDFNRIFEDIETGGDD